MVYIVLLIYPEGLSTILRVYKNYEPAERYADECRADRCYSHCDIRVQSEVFFID